MIPLLRWLIIMFQTSLRQENNPDDSIFTEEIHNSSVLFKIPSHQLTPLIPNEREEIIISGP